MNQLFLTLFSLLVIGRVYAATPVSSPTEIPKTQQIENLKERLATKVAQLRQVQRKAISGTIKATSISTVTVETKTSDIKIELTDEIKVFQNIKGKRTSLTTDNLEKGDHVVVFGEYDSAVDTLTAKVVIIQDPLDKRISGTMNGIDKKNFTVT